MKVVLLVVVFFLIWQWTCSSPLPCETCGTHTACKHSHTKSKRDLQALLQKDNPDSNSDYNTTNSTRHFTGEIVFRIGIPLDQSGNISKEGETRNFSAVQNETNQDNETTDGSIKQYGNGFIIKPIGGTSILPINDSNNFTEKIKIVDPVSKTKRDSNRSYIEQWNDALVKREIKFFNTTEEDKNETIAKQDTVNNQNNTQRSFQNQTLVQSEEILEKNGTDQIKNTTLRESQTNITQNVTLAPNQNKTVVKDDSPNINTIKNGQNITETKNTRTNEVQSVKSKRQDKTIEEDKEKIKDKTTDGEDSEKGQNKNTKDKITEDKSTGEVSKKGQDTITKDKITEDKITGDATENKKEPCVNHHYYIKELPKSIYQRTLARYRPPRNIDVAGTTKSTKEEQAIKEVIKIGTEQEKFKSLGDGIDPKVKKIVAETNKNPGDTKKEKEIKQFETPINNTDFIKHLNFNISVNTLPCLTQIFVSLIEQNATSHTTTEFDIGPIEESQNSLNIENGTLDKRDNFKKNSTTHTAEKETIKYRLKRELTHHRTPRSEQEEKWNTLRNDTRHVEVPLNITIHIQKREDGQANERSVSKSQNATKDHHHSKRDLLETRVVRKATRRPKTNEAITIHSVKGTNMDRTRLPKIKESSPLKTEPKVSTKTQSPQSSKKGEYYPKAVSGGIRDKRSIADSKEPSEKTNLSNTTIETNTNTTSANHTVKSNHNDTNPGSNKEKKNTFTSASIDALNGIFNKTSANHTVKSNDNDTNPGSNKEKKNTFTSASIDALNGIFNKTSANHTVKSNDNDTNPGSNKEKKNTFTSASIDALNGIFNKTSANHTVKSNDNDTNPGSNKEKKNTFTSASIDALNGIFNKTSANHTVKSNDNDTNPGSNKEKKNTFTSASIDALNGIFNKTSANHTVKTNDNDTNPGSNKEKRSTFTSASLDALNGIVNKTSANHTVKTDDNDTNPGSNKEKRSTFTSASIDAINGIVNKTSANHTVKTNDDDTNPGSNKEKRSTFTSASIDALNGIVNKTFRVDVTVAEKMGHSNSEATKNVSNLNPKTVVNTTVDRTRRFAFWDPNQVADASSSVENLTDVINESAPADVIVLKEGGVNTDGDEVGINTDEYLDGYFKYATGDTADLAADNDIIQLNVNEFEVTEKLPMMVERVKCTCAMYRSDPISKNKNPTFAETVLDAPLGKTAADKDVLCTKSCGELAKAHLKIKQDVHCAHVKPDHKNFKEISAYLQNGHYDDDVEMICCQVFTGEDEPTLQFVLSWLNIILLDVVVCLTGLGIVCMYLICFVSWRKREILPTYTAATFAVK